MEEVPTFVFIAVGTADGSLAKEQAACFAAAVVGVSLPVAVKEGYSIATVMEVHVLVMDMAVILLAEVVSAFTVVVDLVAISIVMGLMETRPVTVAAATVLVPTTGITNTTIRGDLLRSEPILILVDEGDVKNVLIKDDGFPTLIKATSYIRANV